ncbi:MAG: zinc ribbon domain-containing protein [Clostridia bacterium]|nr:zinc ribbon domain-containing protein [Clostridia bacterium]
MKSCPSCGNEINDNAILCVNCGTELNSVEKATADLSCIQKNIKLIFIGLLLLGVAFVFSSIWGVATAFLHSLIGSTVFTIINGIFGLAFNGLRIAGLVLGFIGCLNIKKEIENK